MDALGISEIIMNSDSGDSDLVTMMISMMTLTVRQVIRNDTVQAASPAQVPTSHAKKKLKN